MTSGYNSPNVSSGTVESVNRDLNYFTVRDNATFADPHHYATGFHYVFVNGTLVVEHDQHTGARPGRVLRRGSE